MGALEHTATGDARDGWRIAGQLADDIYVLGSGERLAALLQHQLVDAYRICMHRYC